MSESTPPSSAVAIIGMAGRFPGAPDVESFWSNVRGGVESIVRLTPQDLRDEGLDPSILDFPQFVDRAPLLDGIEFFDAPFFGFNPRDAELMDPQHRLFLECAWEALEHAGYAPGAADAAVGVYAGCNTPMYLYNLYSNLELLESGGGVQIIIGNDKDYLATRVSYALNLCGPSVNVQTACSTSLVAIHLACQSLLTCESDLALAGGVSIAIPQKAGYFYQEGGMLSPDGTCRAFDAKARGTIFGNGLGVLVLKRLDAALADGDTIHALILATAVNNDGGRRAAYTAPGVSGQARVVAEALELAGVNPESIGYIEAHGTGTSVGDPIELEALTRAFRLWTPARGYCAIGSVKTNVGHLNTASGAAGVIKVALSLRHREIPPSLHFEQPNPQIDFAESPFFVNTKLRPWDEAATPRRAAVSSFGVGGTNAHAILEEAPELRPSEPSRGPQIVPLSAKTQTALEAATANLASYLERHPDANLADVAYTLQVGRRAFEWRRFVVATQAEAARATLVSSGLETARQPARERSVAFLFPGQGAQYPNMGRGLYETEAVFRRELDRCADGLAPVLGRDLRSLLFPAAGHEEQAAEALRRTEITQPALFALEVALARLWLSYGVQPAAMIGHSIGEYAAAHLAGVWSLKDALRLVATRGRLMGALPPGAMLAVPMAESELLPLLAPCVSLAAVNAASLCVVSGPTPDIDAFEAKCASDQIETRRLHTSHAFHSAMMEPILDAFANELRKIEFSPPQVPFVSNLSGKWIAEEQATSPEYWLRHLRGTVRFAEGAQTLLEEPDRALLEVGPGQTLGSLMRPYAGLSGAPVVASLRHAQQTDADDGFLRTALGRLWTAGVSVDWRALHSGARRRRLPLPTYPFERRRYWIAPKRPDSTDTSNPILAFQKKADMADWFYAPVWRQSLAPASVGSHDPARDPLSWVLFLDANGFGPRVGRRLVEFGHTVVTVVPGEAYRRLSEREFEIRPDEPRDYEALLKDLALAGPTPSRWLHLWTAGPDLPTTPNERLANSKDRGFYSLLFLAQALAQQSRDPDTLIGVVSTRLHRVASSDPLEPEKALVLGPCRVIPHELPKLQCRSIDVEFPDPESRAAATLAEQLARELTTPSVDSVVAYRDETRWVQTFEPVRVPSVAEKTPLLRDGGVYLITGGLGGIGLELARDLARVCSARLALTSRSGLPPREAWEAWLASHDETDARAQRIRAVRSIEEAGGEVLVIAADAADAESMRRAVAHVRERFGTINGVVHAAGVAGGGMIEVKTRDDAEAVFRPKLEGTLALDAALPKDDLDFVLLCSSVTSFLGDFGQVDYCAANAFLDAFAQSRAGETHPRVHSVNWGAWRDAGMAVDTDLPLELERWRAERLLRGITSAEGVDAFRRVLSVRTPQLVVSPLDLGALIRRTREARAQMEEFGQARLPDVSHARPSLANEFVAPRNEEEETLAALWRSLLGLERVGVHDNFFDLGGHSLLATQVLSRIRQSLGLELTLKVFFEHPTVAGLTEALQECRSQASHRDVPALVALARQRQRMARTATGELVGASEPEGAPS